MTSKQRVRLAVSHREADRVPIMATFVPEVTKALRSALKTEEDPGLTLGNDMIKCSVGMENSYYMSSEPTYVCPYGLIWRNVRNGYSTYTEIVGRPLEGELEKLDNYVFPSPLEDSQYDPLRESVKKYGGEKWIVGSCQCSIFETAWYLRGLDRFLIDMLIEEKYADRLLDGALEFPLAAGRKMAELGADMIWFGDDVATQTNMLLSPELWRRKLKPRLAHLFSEVRRVNPEIKTCYHSCGNLEAIIPDLIEIGLDVLNPIQPLAMDPGHVKSRFGDRLTLYGGMDVQNLLPRGTEAEIDREVERLMRECKRGGGLILSPAHHVQNDTPIENILQFYLSAKKYGKY